MSGRDLVTRCPSGVLIVTEWSDRWDYSDPRDQEIQADLHRRRVRSHLQAQELLRRAA